VSRAAPRRAFDALLVTCEHSSRSVPRRWARCFGPGVIERAGHRAVDFGAAGFARRLGRRVAAPVLLADATRLLVDCNRSLGHEALWSEWTADLPESEQGLILARHYRPLRAAAAARLAAHVDRGERVLHVSVHSFTPRLHGRSRRVDIGLLFDPARPRERDLAHAWRYALSERLPDLLVRSNLPYRGWTDGHTTHLRRRLPASRYLGFELELNQRLVGRPEWRRIGDAVADTLTALRHTESRRSR
jgi:predicted N-formylglutamate amidohydrolase